MKSRRDRCFLSGRAVRSESKIYFQEARLQESSADRQLAELELRGPSRRNRGLAGPASLRARFGVYTRGHDSSLAADRVHDSALFLSGFRDVLGSIAARTRRPGGDCG